MTPKIIHYIWVGDAPKPPIVLHCIESWKKNCPGWEIREWGNELVETCGNRYAKEAFKYKKWAFVADWARLYVLHTYGGIYLDTDMEMLKPIDEFLENQLTMAFMLEKGKIYFNGGFIGCQKGNKIIGDLLAEYDQASFVKPNGELDQTTNVVRMLNYFTTQWNLRPENSEKTVTLEKGMTIYPHSFFLSETGYTYHHYCASWFDLWIRKVWLQFGPYKIVRFKLRKEIKKGDITLFDSEKSLFHIQLTHRKIVHLIKTCLTPEE